MRIHFIGIDKNPLSNLALALLYKGVSVSGSDDEIRETVKNQLEKHNILSVRSGWFPETITKDMDAVIVGSHIKADNPELLRAKALDVQLFSLPEFLFEHAKHKTRVVIYGSSGKNTIISMILHVLHYHKRDVDFVMGTGKGSDAKFHLTNENDFILLEGRQQPSSLRALAPTFQGYRPNIALLSGIVGDGTSLLANGEKYLEQAEGFIDAIVKGGILVYNEEDVELKRMVEESTNTIRKHPYHTPAHKVENEVTLLETPEGDMPLEISGKHNLNHLAGAKWICQHLVIDEDDFYEAMASFNCDTEIN